MVTTNNNSNPARMISLPPSLECEMARWVLDRYNVNFVEENHSLPILPMALKRNGAADFPAVITGGKIFTGFGEITAHYENGWPDELKLTPNKEEIDRARDKEKIDPSRVFNLKAVEEFGGSTRAWAYFHLLPRRDLMAPVFSAGIPFWEKLIVWIGYPFIQKKMVDYLSLDAKLAESSLQKAREIFDVVKDQRSDGRKYLQGDRFTLSDIIFSVQAAPMIVPPNYKATYPSFEKLPDVMKPVVEEFRNHETGKFALRLFEEERNIVLTKN